MRDTLTDTRDAKTDLNQLVIFAKVVEAHSFTAAGRALGLPKSTVSRKIAQLEDRLGAQLLRRTTRKLALTEVGAAFYERCARIAGQIDEAEQAVREMDDEPRGFLRVAAPHELGPALLADVINELLLAHAELEIELVLTERVVDPLEQGFDLALQRVAPASRPELLSTELGPARRHLVASPAYLERRGIPREPEDLADHELVVLEAPARGASLQLHGLEGTRSIPARPRLAVDSTTMLRRAALAGVGIATLHAWGCRAELESGRLQVVLRDWTLGPSGSSSTIHAVYPTARHLAAKLRTFLELVEERLESPAQVASAGPTLHRSPTQPYV